MDWSDLEVSYVIAVIVLIALVAVGLAIVLLVVGVIRLAS
jgi:hypothetical protein